MTKASKARISKKIRITSKDASEINDTIKTLSAENKRLVQMVYAILVTKGPTRVACKTLDKVQPTDGFRWTKDEMTGEIVFSVMERKTEIVSDKPIAAG